MVKFCRQNNYWDAYKELAETLSAEEFCNMALTLCHITDKMFCGYLAHLEKTFKEQGGVKERMHAVRTGYRQEQDAKMKALETENAALKQRIAELEKKLGELG